MNLPGRGGRKMSVAAYKISQKFYGFNWCVKASHPDIGFGKIFYEIVITVKKQNLWKTKMYFKDSAFLNLSNSRSFSLYFSKADRFRRNGNSSRIKNQKAKQCKCCTHAYIDHRMLFQEHSGHDDQRGQGKGCCFYKFLFRSVSQFVRDICIARELNTWMLGRIFVGVSVLYSHFTISVKILSLGNSVGRMCWAFG